MGFYKSPSDLRKERKQKRIDRKPELLAQARRDRRPLLPKFSSDNVSKKMDQAVHMLPGMSAMGVLRYTMMPEILPRIRKLGMHFGHFAYLLALVFSSARLIPATHPSLNAANIGRFGVRQIIAIAANNITWSRNNIDQIAIFSAIVIGLIMIVIQAGLIAVMALIGFDNPASAQGFFISPDPVNDPMMIFFAQVFGDLNGFWGADFTSNAYGEDYVYGINTSIHEGVYAMLSLYSMAMMVIAVIIVLYYIMTVVGEAAKTGTPFGQRFNSLWAPIRLVVALGLLVPLGSGLNSAQYLTLTIAKMGAGLGSQVWMRMDEAMGTKNIADSMVGEFQNEWVKEAAFNIFFLETCMYASNKEVNGDPESPDGIRRRVIDSDDPNDRTFKVAYDVNESSLFGGYRSCGEVTVNITAQDINSVALQDGALPIDGAYQLSVDILQEMMGALDTNQTDGKGIPSVALGLANESISIGGYTPSGANTFYYNNVNLVASNIENNALANFDVSGYQDGVQERVDNLLDKRGDSFIYAGIWYLEISRIIQESKDIEANSIPNFNMGTVSIRTQTKVERVGGVMSPTPWLKRVGDETEILMGNLYDDLRVNAARYFSTADSVPQECRNIGAEPSGWDAAACAIAAMIIPDELTILSADNPNTRTLDPMSTMIDAGYSIFQKAWTYIGWGLVGSAFGGLINAFGAMGGLIGAAAGGFGSIISSLGSIAVLVGTLGLTAGFILYFLLPVLPFIYFFFAVVAWVMEIFEAVIAMPLWALAHLRIDGDGMPGQAAMNGYFLLLAILLRPALIVVGLVAGALIFGAAIFMLQSLFDSVLVIKGSGNSSGLENLIYALIFAYTTYSAGITSFKLVDSIPNQIIRWIGAGVGTFSEGKEDPVQGNVAVLGAAGGFVGSQLSGNLSSGAGGIGQSGGKGLATAYSNKFGEGKQTLDAQRDSVSRDIRKTEAMERLSGSKPSDNSPLKDPRD